MAVRDTNDSNQSTKRNKTHSRRITRRTFLFASTTGATLATGAAADRITAQTPSSGGYGNDAYGVAAYGGVESVS